MKITAQEEYGLRILIRIASCEDANGINILQISEAEGLSSHYVAKLTRVLRMAGFINSTPGYKGGYVLAKPANKIIISNLLKTLGGSLFDTEFCGSHAGNLKLCINSVDCSSRSLWNMIQITVDRLLEQMTLHDLIGTEKESSKKIAQLLEENIQ